MRKVTFLRDVAASPDHNHTRIYKKGEVHEIGSSLMPEGLADALSSQYVPSGRSAGLITLDELEGKQSEPCVRIEDKNISDDQRKANAEIHSLLFENRRVMDW